MALAIMRSAHGTRRGPGDGGVPPSPIHSSSRSGFEPEASSLRLSMVPSFPRGGYRSGAKYPCRLCTTIPVVRVLISTIRHLPSREELVEV